jgi:predicted nucleic acid-binding Zn ribbon protein
MYCKNCGNEIQAEENFCSKCGTPIGKPAKKSKKKPSKIMPIMIAVGAVCALFGIGSLVMGKSGDSKGISRKSDVPLITQLENEYGIELSGIAAAGGSAVDNMVLEDYLPRVDFRRFTTVINSEDNTENLIEEMTIDLPNDDGGYNYSVYNYLTEYTVQGVIFPDESGELYYMKQTNMLDDSVADMDFYIGLPGKTWTLEKKNEDTTIEMSIAPEFYTVTTPYGTYENCLLKYEHSSCETASWANSHTFTAYAPYGVGKIYSVTYSEDSPEAPFFCYPHS